MAAVPLSAMLILAACQNGDMGTQPKPGATGPSTEVDTVMENPGQFYGKTVRMSGDIDNVYGDQAFELEGTGWAFGDNITVLTKTPVRIGGAALDTNDEVIVVGTVRPFVVAEIERDLGWDLSPDLEAKLYQRPVLVATSIRTIGEYGTWLSTGEKAPLTNSVAIIVANPADLAGHAVDLGQERVQALQGKGLWVGRSAMSRVFVLPKEPLQGIKAGDTVHVTGTLQKAPQNAATAWDLPPAMEGEVGEGALFVDAATVNPVAADQEKKPANRSGQPGQR